jgi:hypothetical protein
LIGTVACDLKTGEEGQVTAAQVALGIAVVPNPYSSLLSIERAQASNFKFRNGQLGGGRCFFVGSQLYLQGYVTYQNYAS